MKYISRFFLFFFVLFVGSAHAVESGTRIFIVDENDKAFDAETVRWWYSGKRNTKYELKCFNDRCDERLLSEGWMAPLIVSADESVVEPEDASCWKLFHGEVLLASSVKEIKIVMRYKNKVCK